MRNADTAHVKAKTDRTNGRTPEPVPGADTPAWGHRVRPFAFGGRADAMPYAARCCDAPLVRVSHPKEHALATPNYGYEKRQRELAKKRKAEEKKQKKLHGGGTTGPDDHGHADPSTEPPAAADTPPPSAG